MHYHIITYGCQMNIHESEKAAGILQSRGFSATDDINKADLVLFNTCCIREGAENRATGNIGALKKIKQQNSKLITVVIGCMTQQEGKAEFLSKKFPYIDIILGTHNLMSLGEKLDGLLLERVRCYEIIDADAAEMDPPKIVRSGNLNAWINIMYGCNNFCTYCIVPFVRGREHSRTIDDILREAEEAVRAGYKEITLLGQNVNSYGNDISDPDVNFASLLRRLSAIEGDFRIKFMTSHPKDFTVEVALAMKECAKVAPYLHLPVQSGSTRILSAMNRKYTRDDYLKKIELLRAHIPTVGLTTDIMVGFPTETDEDFEQTMDLVRSVRFDNMFMFVYSRRKGTVADKMDQVPEEIKNTRIRELVALNRKIAAEKAAECVGKRYRALVENSDIGLCATTDCGKFVTLQNGDHGCNGQFVQLEITAHKAGKLSGRIL